MPRAPRSLCAGVIAYFLAMAAISLVAWQLSSVVTAKAIALSLPFMLDKDPRRPSRIEQRHIDLAQAVPPMPVAKVAALQEPAVSYDVLAAQLDNAETEVLEIGPAPRLRKHLAKFRSRSRYAPSAADDFNRSFGVIPVAAN